MTDNMYSTPKKPQSDVPRPNLFSHEKALKETKATIHDLIMEVERQRSAMEVMQRNIDRLTARITELERARQVYGKKAG